MTYIVEPDWPKLAWLATCRAGEAGVEVRHGPQVETNGDWFCEAVWDGEFSRGDFDRVDIVFGSGGRVRSRGLTFVSAGSTVDRLQYLRQGKELLVSNSLACLFACSGARPDLSFEDYPEFFRSITAGVDRYRSVLPTSAGEIHLVYFRNLHWDGTQVSVVDKPDPGRDFSTFDKYRSFLSGAMRGISANMADGARRHRYDLIAALSSGYDLTTATVLAREVGLRAVFSFLSSRSGKQDDGRETAKRLGLDISLVERLAWRQQPFAEVPYFAATGLGPDVIFSGARELLAGRVLVTGFHGDKIWGKHTKALGRDIVRGDASGLSFTEHRLMLGTLHLPVAFMGVRDIAQINQLSNAEEMRPWDLGGTYSRPICRRIAEDQGVPRECFGQTKLAATSLFHLGEARMNDETASAYRTWLKNPSRSVGADSRSAGSAPSRAVLLAQEYYPLAQAAIRRAKAVSPDRVSQWLGGLDTRWQRSINRRVNSVSMLFPFSIDRMMTFYGNRQRTAAPGLDDQQVARSI